MANLIDLAGEAGDFEKAKWILTGQTDESLWEIQASQWSWNRKSEPIFATYYDSETEGKLTLEKLATNSPLSNGRYYGFVIVNDTTVMFAKGM